MPVTVTILYNKSKKPTVNYRGFEIHQLKYILEPRALR